MKYLYPFLLIILFLSFSCNKSKTVHEVSNNTDSLKIDSKRITSTISETLMPTAKKALLDWKEYHNVDEFMIKYYSITPAEALTNAKELSDLVKLMRDSIRVEKLNQINVIARFNVLHNETLRLADLVTIPSISKDEVKDEVSKIVEIYNAVNSKINTIYNTEDLQDSLEVDTETPIDLSKEQELERAQNRNFDRIITPEKQ